MLSSPHCVRVKAQAGRRLHLFYSDGSSTSSAWVQNEDRSVERKTVFHSLCHWAAGFGMQTHAQLRHNPDNLAAALGSQVYCVLLKLSLPKVYFTEQWLNEEQKSESPPFLLFAKNICPYMFFFFFENVGIRLTVKGQKYKSCKKKKIELLIFMSCFLVEILLKILIQDVSSEIKLVSFVILILKWTVYWKTNWKMINIRIFSVLLLAQHWLNV